MASAVLSSASASASWPQYLWQLKQQLEASSEASGGLISFGLNELAAAPVLLRQRGAKPQSIGAIYLATLPAVSSVRARPRRSSTPHSAPSGALGSASSSATALAAASAPTAPTAALVIPRGPRGVEGGSG